MLTGDVLQVVIHCAQPGGLRGYLKCRGLNDWTAQWDAPPTDASNSWSLWTDAAMTSGLSINLGDTVFLTSRDPSYAGNYLIQYLPNYPDYLTVGPNTVPYQFQIRTEDGGTTSVDADPRRSPPPPDTRG